MKAPREERLVLGVDCGGTYTDAVIYDLESERVVAFAKRPTSHHDLALSISRVLDELPASLLREVLLTSLSTTLATNAIVEERGGNACLILLGYEEASCTVPRGARLVNVSGKHDVAGEEIEPLDETALVAAVREHATWADAFAISGYFSVRNPAHEMRARAIVRSHTKKPVICGHELSMQLDAPRRAITAALNARLVPIATSLIASARSIMRDRGIDTPLMVVRGDGTLMCSDLALERPIETILSGPAASVVGALALSGATAGVVIDVGGTTTDMAWVENGLPPISSEGAVVGNLATRVEAINIRTAGLGGDSWIKLFRNGGMEVGPRRVLPIAMLPNDELVARSLQVIRESRPVWSTSDMLSFWCKVVDAGTPLVDEGEETIRQMIEVEPVPHVDLKSFKGDTDLSLRILDMEHRGLVFRSSLTPTDIFNAAEESTVGNVALSKMAVDTAAHLVGKSPQKLIQEVKARATESITIQLLLFLLGLDGKDTTMLNKWLSGKPGPGIRFELNLDAPILGVGAPAGLFLPPVASRLACECVVPPFMQVANAVGAVAGVVSHREEIQIQRQPDGTYRAFASDGRYDFAVFSAASAFAEEKGGHLAVAEARRAGAEHIEVHKEFLDLTLSDTVDDSPLLERRVIVRAHGRPRMRALP